MRITTTLLFVSLAFIFNSCTEEIKINIEEEKVNVLNTDFAFSAMSEEKGISKAFIEYAATAGVLLKKESRPIEGKVNIEKLYKAQDLKDYVLTWKPIKATVSKSADIAYTYGIYEYRTKGAKILKKGTYVTIWEKQKDGNWKWVLDSGNEGLEKTAPLSSSDSISTNSTENIK